jgi:release factor glutamine methyltransferase
MKYEDIWKPLVSRYGDKEAKAITRYLLEVGYGLSMTDILCGATEQLPPDEMGENLRRLIKGEPVQYVVGKAEFGGRTFKVTPDVLIPRPETYELCQWVVEEKREERREERDFSVLDIGTGSGCIAITLALDIPNAQVEAWDISEGAINIARQNAKSLNAQVCFRLVDALNVSPKDSSLFTLHSSLNVIVSNPPYICKKEAASMEQHVLDHEPHQALFVPDEDPLVFYKAIGQYACHALANHGCLFFEINPLYATEITKMLDEMGFFEIETRKDQFGKVRFVRARKEL